MAILTIGFNPAIDRILECPDFHIGGHQQAKQIARLAAGKAANVNRALAQLGTDSIATGFVGVDDLEFFHEQLMSTGPGRVLCRFVEVGVKHGKIFRFWTQGGGWRRICGIRGLR